MMKPSADDETAGKVHEIKRTIQDTFGELSNSTEPEVDGEAERKPGKGSTLDREG